MMEITGVSRDEEGKKKVEKVEVPRTRRPDTIRYFERKLVDKGIHRMDRHPADGLGGLHQVPKSGHGGKFTWEGPADEAYNELDPVPPAIDPNDPNYVEEEEEEPTRSRGEQEDEAEEGVMTKPSDALVVGEVEVAKVAEAKEGISRIEVLPPLQP
ncbi:uncharacterized protein [Elaeis guineensis]|uniref:Uncharacterized protein LOC105038195 n=1 Tax=Elaeis guineensis var. tenera TaxID=51953 RepID=A0A8N4EVP7_ELAGV|nr:uncharacterized protein LOC105038195 [Elaeis guineensis]